MTVWALGDYHRFATATVWPLGRLLVDACGVEPGQRLLDVAAGTGNVAIRAAQTGAHVVASDLTPEQLHAGKQAAAAQGVTLDWVEADVQSLPFPDNDFHVVTSCVGAIFAPDHAAAAGEMLRVCRPGGTVAMINFKPVGLAADFFALLDRHAQPPSDAPSPLLWGDRQHIEALFAGRVESLDMTDGQYVEGADEGPDGYRTLLETTFGPVIAVRASLAADPERLMAFDHEFRDLTLRADRGPVGGPSAYCFDYLLVRARKRS